MQDKLMPWMVSVFFRVKKKWPFQTAHLEWGHERENEEHLKIKNIEHETERKSVKPVTYQAMKAYWSLCGGLSSQAYISLMAITVLSWCWDCLSRRTKLYLWQKKYIKSMSKVLKHLLNFSIHFGIEFKFCLLSKPCTVFFLYILYKFIKIYKTNGVSEYVKENHVY